jgi:hypothetical protein
MSHSWIDVSNFRSDTSNARSDTSFSRNDLWNRQFDVSNLGVEVSHSWIDVLNFRIDVSVRREYWFFSMSFSRKGISKHENLLSETEVSHKCLLRHGHLRRSVN